MSIPLFLHLVLMLSMISLVVTGVVNAHKRGKGWLTVHKRFAFAGVIVGVIGFGTMAIFKAVNSYPHFVSQHAKSGLFALILILCAPLMGLLITKGYKSLRIPHRTIGYIAIIVSTLAAVFGAISVLPN